MQATLELRRVNAPSWTRLLPIIGLGVGLAIALTHDPGAVGALTLVGFGGFVGLIAAIDVTRLRAPNRLVYPAIILALGAAALPGGVSFASSIGGAVLAFVLLYFVAVVGRGAMGFGDVKFGAACGAVLGFQGVVPMLAFAFIGGGAIAAAVLLVRIRGRKDVVAFTPFLGVAALAALALLPLAVLE